MGTIKFVDADERQFVTVIERAKTDPILREAMARMPGGEASSAGFTHHTGTSEEPQLEELQFPPGAKVPPHAHETDEIIVVTKGEIQFGKQSYGPGSSVFIPKMTLYSFQAGDEGVTILNFRPTIAKGAIFKDEFMALRAEAADA